MRWLLRIDLHLYRLRTVAFELKGFACVLAAAARRRRHIPNAQFGFLKVERQQGCRHQQKKRIEKCLFQPFSRAKTSRLIAVGLQTAILGARKNRLLAGARQKKMKRRLHAQKSTLSPLRTSRCRLASS